jgi:hypothetical protein
MSPWRLALSGRKKHWVVDLPAVRWAMRMPSRLLGVLDAMVFPKSTIVRIA